MALMDLNADSLSRTMEVTVPDIYVTVAKNSVSGLDNESIAQLLGVERQELEQILSDQLYKDVRLLIASEYAKESVEADFSWDSLENTALKGLAKKVPHMTDPDQLLRVAAVANRAQRRQRDTGPKVLDPALAGQRVGLVLTDRIVRKLQSGSGTAIEEHTRQVRVTDGSASNPSFAEVDKALGVSARPRIPENFATRTHGADFGLEDLEFKG